LVRVEELVALADSPGELAGADDAELAAEQAETRIATGSRPALRRRAFMVRR
jgi:hypothetical protein